MPKYSGATCRWTKFDPTAGQARIPDRQRLCLAIIGPGKRADGAHHEGAHANSSAADPGGGRRWQPMTVDVASRRRLNDVNESFEHQAERVVVDHSLIPRPELDKFSCQTMRGLTPQRRSDDAARKVEVGQRRQRRLARAPTGR